MHLRILSFSLVLLFGNDILLGINNMVSKKLQDKSIYIDNAETSRRCDVFLKNIEMIDLGVV